MRGVRRMSYLLPASSASFGGFGRMPSVQRASYRRELGLDPRSGRRQSTDDHDPDQASDQPIFDGRRAGFAFNKVLKQAFHLRLSYEA